MNVRGKKPRQYSSALKLKAAFAVFFAICSPIARAQPLPQSERVADAAIKRWPMGRFTASASDGQWKAGIDLLLEGLDAEWLGAANPTYFSYVEAAVDGLISPDGAIAGYDGKASSLDNIAPGPGFLLLYRVTRQERYFKAAATLRKQLAAQPRNLEGGLQHGRGDPGRMQVDDLFKAEPFYAQYASAFQEPRGFSDITHQFLLIDRHARDARTGLFNQWWDDEGKPAAADPESGSSPALQARSTAWMMMALVDTLPWYPRDDPGRAALLAMLRHTAFAAALAQDRQSGLWAGEFGGSRESGDSLQASTACMFIYAFAKAVRLGYLPESYSGRADRAYRGVTANLNDLSTIDGNPETAGALLLASREMEVAPLAKLGRGRRVRLDAWFNSQKRSNAEGRAEYFHYKWADYSDSGFSLLGHLFNDYGIETETLYEAPTAANLGEAQFYIIVSPDIPVKNPNPHYMSRKDAEQIAAWVRQGGILLMMENDPGNADIDHLDILADLFGLHFNRVLSHHVIGDTLSMGRIEVAGGGELFDRSHVLYMKDTCTLSPGGKARPLLIDKGDVMMAAARYGKGTVFAVVDPWLYNEYTDGRKLPPEYDNFRGAQALIGWLVRQLQAKAASPEH